MYSIVRQLITSSKLSAFASICQISAIVSKLMKKCSIFIRCHPRVLKKRQAHLSFSPDRSKRASFVRWVFVENREEKRMQKTDLFLAPGALNVPEHMMLDQIFNKAPIDKIHSRYTIHKAVTPWLGASTAP
jgi:hemolysin-activating ACP:hemolysin acyltransferase